MSKKKVIEELKPLYEMAEYKPWVFGKICTECGKLILQETIYEITIRWKDKQNPKVRYEEMPIDKYCFCSNCCLSLIEAEKLFIEKYLQEYEEKNEDIDL